MLRGSYHPKAFLRYRKNIRPGLAARTRIVSLLEVGSLTAKALSERVGAGYSSALHHLHLMEEERIVTRQGERPYLWKLTGIGQRRLIEG